MYVFHSSCPVRTSSATTAPRNVQHSYPGRPARPSSFAAMPTYATPSWTIGELVTIAAMCSWTFVSHNNSPLRRSTANTCAPAVTSFRIQPSYDECNRAFHS